MSWYYVENGQQRGPVDEAALESLIREGTIRGETLVWQEGMSTWQSYSSVAAAAQPVEPAVGLAPDPSLVLATCSRCRQSFSLDEVVQLGGAPVCASCKPIVLQSMQEGVPLNSDAEAVRKVHLSHEASVKSIGLLYFLSGGLMAMAGLMSFFIPASTRSGAAGGGIVFGFILVFLAVLLISVGAGLRKLRPWSRVVSGILAGIGLLGFPLGTLINGYILYLLLSKKGAVVFSAPYQQVIAATPHVKYRTSVIVWIVVGILILLALAAIFGGIWG